MVVNVFLVPLVLIYITLLGCFRTWTIYVRIFKKSDSKILFDVKRYFMVIFSSEFLFHILAGIYAGVLNLVAMLNVTNSLKPNSNAIFCKASR